MGVPAKTKHRTKLLEYLSDPNNEFPTREYMSLYVLGFSHRQTVNKVFTPKELHEIEQEALENRRRKYASVLAKVDNALLERAQQGDPQAIKLVYQRFEGWSEKKELTGKDGQPLPQNQQIIVQFVDASNRSE